MESGNVQQKTFWQRITPIMACGAGFVLLYPLNIDFDSKREWIESMISVLELG